VYLQARQGVQAIAPYNPFLSLTPGAFPRPFGAAGTPRPPPPATRAPSDDVADLRREVEELKKTLNKRRR